MLKLHRLRISKDLNMVFNFLTAIGDFTLSTEKYAILGRLVEMLKLVILSIFLFLHAPESFGKGFQFNYKNLNTLASIICAQSQMKLPAPHVQVSKFAINRQFLNPQKSEFNIVLNGTCNATIDPAKKEVLHFGQEFSLRVEKHKKLELSGEMGLEHFKINFKNGLPYLLTINGLFHPGPITIKLAQTNWSKRDSLINFNQKENISVKVDGRIMASELNSHLNLRNGPRYFNIWRFDTFGCKSSKALSQQNCETLSSLL